MFDLQFIFVSFFSKKQYNEGHPEIPNTVYNYTISSYAACSAWGRFLKIK
jgi:hypothetical protein